MSSVQGAPRRGKSSQPRASEQSERHPGLGRRVSDTPPEGAKAATGALLPWLLPPPGFSLNACSLGFRGYCTFPQAHKKTAFAAGSGWAVSELSFWFCDRLFARSDSAGGANICASAAVNTYAGVDRVLSAFRDSARGAFIDASAASNAIVANYVSHNSRI